jgi:hypothetical protein
MDIDRLTKAANAAGFAMANSEELLVPVPQPKTTDEYGWRAAEPSQHGEPQKALEPVKPAVSFRDWWLALSSKATA